MRKNTMRTKDEEEPKKNKLKGATRTQWT
jgi:hypothetical protein